MIGLMIVPRTWKLLRETLDVLLESAPKDVDMAEVRRTYWRWTASRTSTTCTPGRSPPGMPVLSAHVVVRSDVLNAIGHEKMLHELQGCLGDHFDVEHCTFQLEPVGHAEHEARLCH